MDHSARDVQWRIFPFATNKIMYELDHCRIMITGGCGFIGSNVINYIQKRYPDAFVLNVDRLDYDNTCGYLETTDHYKFIKADCADKNFILHLLQEYRIDTVIHFAAQTHVDKSFDNSIQFTMDNVYATHVLMECVRKYGMIRRFLHFSTDEVYGEVKDGDEACHEYKTLDPTNPYAATKAAAEFIVRSYYHSFRVPIIIARCNNVYGLNQFPDKLIPKFIMLLQAGRPCTIQGDGSSKRTFVHAMDVAAAVCCMLEHGSLCTVYNIGSSNQEISVVDMLRVLVEKIVPEPGPLDQYIVWTKDRPFNDCRYHIDNTALRSLGWRERIHFSEAIDEMIVWYSQHGHGFHM